MRLRFLTALVAVLSVAAAGSGRTAEADARRAGQAGLAAARGLPRDDPPGRRAGRGREDGQGVRQRPQGSARGAGLRGAGHQSPARGVRRPSRDIEDTYRARRPGHRREGVHRLPRTDEAQGRAGEGQEGRLHAPPPGPGVPESLAHPVRQRQLGIRLPQRRRSGRREGPVSPDRSARQRRPVARVGQALSRPRAGEARQEPPRPARSAAASIKGFAAAAAAIRRTSSR